MIELDDAVTNLNLGVDEYIALKKLDVRTIRNLLLLDIDKVVSLEVSYPGLRERICIWQKLLRRYLAYDKIHAARKKEVVTEEKLKIHDPVSQVGLGITDVEILQKLGIHILLDILETHMGRIKEMAEYDQSIYDRIITFKNHLVNKEIFEKKSVAKPSIDKYPKKSVFVVEKPEKTVTPEEFVDEPVTEINLNLKELKALKALNIKTVREFLVFDVNMVKKIKNYDERMNSRLASWQRYIRKKLHWKETH